LTDPDSHPFTEFCLSETMSIPRSEPDRSTQETRWLLTFQFSTLIETDQSKNWTKLPKEIRVVRLNKGSAMSRKRKKPSLGERHLTWK
jgi:hypothetical protein